MASTIFNLGAVKLLKKILRFQESDIQIITGNSADPTVTAVDAVAGSIYIRGGTNEVYVKNTSGSNTDFSKLGTVDSLNNHLNDTTDAHDASAISNVPAGNLAATDVQGALNELQSELDGKALASDLSNHLSDATDAHDASAISSVASGNLAATDVQSALNELQSDIDTRALDSAVIKKNGSVAYTAAQSMGGFKITSLAAGTASSDAVNKGQMDAALEGLKPKAAVRVATTATITIATALNAGDVIDGITLANGDRVLLKDQAAPEENGIYVVSATPARSTDFDSLSPVDEINGSLVAVQEGTANAGKVFVQSGAVATLDTDPINFVFFNSSASLVGGDGITVSGSNISVDHDGAGLTFSANQLALELDGTTLAKSASGLKLNDTAVTAASYGSATQVPAIAIDAQGRITSATNTTIAIASTAVTDFAEAAQDAVGATLTDSSTIDFTYDDGAGTITAIVIDSSITDAKIATGIDATKLADGSVTNTELQYINTVTSNVQTQINAKADQSTVNTQLSNKANTSLNNLVTTAVNITLSPGTDLTHDLGSTTRRWANNYSQTSYSREVRYFDLDQSNYISLRSPNTVTANVSYVLPATDGSSGDVLQTDGAGNLTFSAAAAAYTNEQAQDAVGGILTDSATIDFTYDDTANTITAIVIDASITNAKIATGIDAVKLADGSVTNTELQYINSLTSNAQTQLNAKEPLHNTTLVQAANASLDDTATNEVITGLTFAHASFNGCTIDYRIQKGTLVRVGKILVATDGTNVALNDSFVETVDSTIVFDAVVNGANIEIRQTNAETGTITMTYQQNKFAV